MARDDGHDLDPLFRPLTLPCGTILENRVGKAAMSDSLGDGSGHPTEAQCRLYERWAEGGVAVSIVGEVQGHPGFAEKPGNLVLWPGADLGRFRALSRIGNAEGVQLWVQLGHAGAMAHPPISEPKGPSAIDIPGLTCAALTREEIRDLPPQFARTARMAKDAGFGGVEIHAAHGFLLSQFLSPLFNRRGDAYGGAVTGRMRLLLEVVGAVRDAVGPGFPVAVKLNATDQLEGGFEREDALTVIAALDGTGIDLIDISGGTYFPGARSASDEAGAGPYFTEFAMAARAVTEKPLMVTGGFKTMRQMIDAVSGGSADIVGLARALALDPALPNAWRAGMRADPVFPKFASPPGRRDHRLVHHAADRTRGRQRDVRDRRSQRGARGLRGPGCRANGDMDRSLRIAVRMTRGKGNAMTTGFVWDERFAWHQQGIMPLGPDAEPFPGPDTPETKRRIYGLVQTSGLATRLVTLDPRPATDQELCRLHDPAYVERVKEASAGDGGSVGESVSIGAGGYEIAALAAGGCLAAVDAVLEGQVDNAYALVRPAGHHAEVSRGRGFCVFGNTALAALHARAVHGVERLAIVDWDVHHGNGTEDAFYTDPNVLTVSVHQDGNYPAGRGGLDDRGEGAGEGANINVPLPPGSGHEAYIKTIETVVLPALRSHRPELILIASGVDASVRDPMGRMLLGGETFRIMTARLMAAAADLCAGRLVACHEGGYAPTHAPFCTLPILETLAGHRTGVVDPMTARLERMPGYRLQPAQAAVIERAARHVEGVPAAASRVAQNQAGDVPGRPARPK